MQSKGKCSTLVLLVLLSMRKVLEVNPLWESCLYEVADSRQIFYVLIFGTLVIFVLFCFCVFFFSNYAEIEELRVDIESYHGMKVKLKLFMH